VKTRYPDVSAATRRNPSAPKPSRQAAKIPKQGTVGSRKTLDPKPHFGHTAKKPENDDRPLKHGKVQKSHKKRQILEQQKI
jgi:hypothetical protein